MINRFVVGGAAGSGVPAPRLPSRMSPRARARRAATPTRASPRSTATTGCGWAATSASRWSGAPRLGRAWAPRTDCAPRVG